MSQLLRVREFANEANIRESTVRAWILYGKIKVIRLSRKAVRIPRQELDRLMQEGLSVTRGR